MPRLGGRQTPRGPGGRLGPGIDLAARDKMNRMQVAVRRIDEGSYEVTVEGSTTTTHVVTLLASYYQKLTNGKMTPEGLIERSFEFLLEREPNTSILRRFDLPVIQTYFPEYEETMQRLNE